MMNLSVKLNDILFLDIETVPEKEQWNELSKETQELFEKKHTTTVKKNIQQRSFMSGQVFGQNLVK